eukprot:4774545-Amphidinium_carterae.2
MKEEGAMHNTSLPVDDDPESFGLHGNALIIAQASQARTYLDTVLSIQPRETSAGGGQKPEAGSSIIRVPPYIENTTPREGTLELHNVQYFRGQKSTEDKGFSS